MKSFRVNLLLFLLMMLTRSIEIDAFVAKCDLKDSGYCCGFATLYTCNLNNSNEFRKGDFNIDGASGLHQPGKNVNDIQAFKVFLGNHMSEFPTNLNAIFPSLIAIKFFNCYLRELNQSNLKSLPNLRYLDITSNFLRFIREDTFKANPNLEVILLIHNRIRHIDPLTFSHLSKLNSIDLAYNEICSDLGVHESRSEVEEIIQKVENRECDSTFTTLSTSTTTTEKSTTMMSLNLSDQEQQIKNLKDENKELREVIFKMSSTTSHLVDQLVECNAERRKLSDDLAKKTDL